MAGTVEEYQDALKQLEEAEADAQAMVDIIAKVRECFYDSMLGSFVGWNFDISGQIEPGRRYDQGAKVDLSQWPSADDMERVFKNWHSSLQEAQAAWEALPADRQRGLMKPPRFMSLRGIRRRP